MKIECNCGERIEVVIDESFPIANDRNFVRRACQKCRRAYEISVTLVTEKPKWWEF